MKYLNANSILPDALVEELQKYIQGEYLYIPIKKEEQRQWGELSGYRTKIALRNQEITEKYRNGTSVQELADGYYLSPAAVRKIIYAK